MKMRLAWVFAVFALVALSVVDAKKKRKFEGDFEFAEEVRALLLLFLSHAVSRLFLLGNRCYSSWLCIKIHSSLSQNAW